MTAGTIVPTTTLDYEQLVEALTWASDCDYCNNRTVITFGESEYCTGCTMWIIQQSSLIIRRKPASCGCGGTEARIMWHRHEKLPYYIRAECMTCGKLVGYVAKAAINFDKRKRQQSNQKLRQQLIETWDSRCAKCSTPITAETCEIDHRISVHHGEIIGLTYAQINHIANLQPLCIACNRQKREKSG